jgi:hypothetical protein
MLAVLFDGVVYSSWLFLMAAGLTLIYGVMRILNIAHGSLYALGAYAAATLRGRMARGGVCAGRQLRDARGRGDPRRHRDGAAPRARPAEVDVRQGRGRAAPDHLRRISWCSKTRSS